MHSASAVDPKASFAYPDSKIGMSYVLMHSSGLVAARHRYKKWAKAAVRCIESRNLPTFLGRQQGDSEAIARLRAVLSPSVKTYGFSMNLPGARKLPMLMDHGSELVLRRFCDPLSALLNKLPHDAPALRTWDDSARRGQRLTDPGQKLPSN